MRSYNNYKYSSLSSEIIKCAYYVFNELGFGYLESVYEKALEIKLHKEGFKVTRQAPINVFFEGVVVGEFFADLLVEDAIIIELKAVEKLHSKHEVQLVNYLKSTDIEVGLLLNFGEELKIKRRVFSTRRKEKT